MLKWKGTPVTFAIRPFHPSDMPVLYRICLRTGADGADATADFTDPDLLGHVYVGPYLAFEPDLSLVLTHDDAPVGYVLGTADSALFADRCQSEWFPELRRRYPLPSDNWVIRLIHQGGRTDPALADYPAHLHIDLLPEAQGEGRGRSLLTAFLDLLRRRGVAGVHLTASATNGRALAFYDRLGFARLSAEGGGVTFGLRLN